MSAPRTAPFRTLLTLALALTVLMSATACFLLGPDVRAIIAAARESSDRARDRLQDSTTEWTLAETEDWETERALAEAVIASADAADGLLDDAERQLDRLDRSQLTREFEGGIEALRSAVAVVREFGDYADVLELADTMDRLSKADHEAWEFLMGVTDHFNHEEWDQGRDRAQTAEQMFGEVRADVEEARTTWPDAGFDLAIAMLDKEIEAAQEWQTLMELRKVMDFDDSPSVEAVNAQAEKIDALEDEIMAMDTPLGWDWPGDLFAEGDLDLVQEHIATYDEAMDRVDQLLESGDY